MNSAGKFKLIGNKESATGIKFLTGRVIS